MARTTNGNYTGKAAVLEAEDARDAAECTRECVMVGCRMRLTSYEAEAHGGLCLNHWIEFETQKEKMLKEEGYRDNPREAAGLGTNGQL